MNPLNENKQKMKTIDSVLLNFYSKSNMTFFIFILSGIIEPNLTPEVIKLFSC